MRIEEVIRSLGEEFSNGGPGGKPGRLHLRQGFIVSVQPDATATVTVGGDTTELTGVKVASHVCPIPSASCWLAVDGRDAFIVATLAPSGPAHGRMRRATTQSIANNSFVAVDFSSRTGGSSRGIALVDAGLEVRVPGLYAITATARFNTNTTGQRIIRLLVGSTVWAEGQSTQSFNRDVVLAIAATVPATIGDVISLQVFQNSGAALDLNVGNGQNILAATWLGPNA